MSAGFTPRCVHKILPPRATNAAPGNNKMSQVPFIDRLTLISNPAACVSFLRRINSFAGLTNASQVVRSKPNFR